MKVSELEIPGVILIEPAVHKDKRGFFLETYHEERYAALGVPGPFVQDNHSKSVKGTVRGLHFQLGCPQGKLVRVTSGEVFDVAVDVRKGSPSFGKWVGAYLSAENMHQLYIPEGFAHGFCVTTDSAEFLYKCTDYYSPAEERGILWNDPDIDVSWPVSHALISDRDSALKTLSEMTNELPPFDGSA